MLVMKPVEELRILLSPFVSFESGIVDDTKSLLISIFHQIYSILSKIVNLTQT